MNNSIFHSINERSDFLAYSAMLTYCPKTTAELSRRNIDPKGESGKVETKSPRLNMLKRLLFNWMILVFVCDVLFLSKNSVSLKCPITTAGPLGAFSDIKVLFFVIIAIFWGHVPPVSLKVKPFLSNLLSSLLCRFFAVRKE